MLFLLPPSESKRIGGNGPSISEIALPFNQLNEARESAIKAMELLCENETLAVRALKLPKTQLHMLGMNRQIRSSPTLPAIERYSGTLYEALDVASFDARSLARLGEQVLIQSSLFGLISASSMIPNYRHSATTVLPGVQLKQLWQQAHSAVFKRLEKSAPIIDLRSKSYADLAPIDAAIESYWVEVVTRVESGEVKALNHFNKKAKGELVAAAMRTSKPIESVAQLKRVAAKLNFDLHQTGSKLTLVV